MLSGIKTQKSFIDQLGERKMKIKELVNEVSIVDLVKAIKKDPTIPNLPQNATFMQRAQTLANNKKVDNLVDLVQKGWNMKVTQLTKANNGVALNPAQYQSNLQRYLDDTVLTMVKPGDLNKFTPFVKNITNTRQNPEDQRKEFAAMMGGVIDTTSAVAGMGGANPNQDIRQTAGGLDVGGQLIRKDNPDYAVFQKYALAEGGKIFKDVDGNPGTQRIQKADVLPTVRWLEQLTGLPLQYNMLGSTGIKADSGDIDLAVDVSKMSKDQLVNILQGKGYSLGQDIKKSGDNVHLRTPIRGSELNGFVQTDFMFGEPQWQKWALSGAPEGSAYKASHKNILLASIAKALGYKWSLKNGLVDRKTDKTVSKDPTTIAKILLKSSDPKDLASFESVLDAVKRLPNWRDLTGDASDTLDKENIKLEHTLHESFVSKVFEGARIEHPEDLIFDRGSRGAEQAISLLNNLPDKQKDITVKWDGKPAIIWGRNEQGQFILTDKAGFNAKGYDGMFQSPDQLSTQLMARGPGREGLAGIYRSLWPMLEKQTPKDVRGYIMGDLLYVNTPPVKDGKYVFTPNTVTYSIKQDSKLGQQIGDSKAGVAVHTYSKDRDTSAPMTDASVKGLPKGDVLLLTPQMREQPNLNIDTSALQTVYSIVTSNAQAINNIFNPQELRANKLSMLPALFKEYANEKVRQGNFNNMYDGFLPFAKSKAKVSDAMYERMATYVAQNKKAITTMFYVFSKIAEIKTNIIRQLDSTGGSIEASIGNEAGHEGYVVGGLKLVDRFRFSRTNFAKNI